MFLEDSSVGREVWRESHLSLLNKVSELFPVVLQQESLRDGPLCYIAVKVREKLHASWISPLHSSQAAFVVFVTDLRAVISAGVFADISAVVQRSGSSSVGQGAQGCGSADDPAGSYGHNTRTSILLIHQFRDTYWTDRDLFSCYLCFVSPVCASCLAVLQQGHSPSGRYCCGHADQHSAREQSWRSCCLESATGLSLR